jgi:hypothetical protein
MERTQLMIELLETLFGAGALLLSVYYTVLIVRFKRAERTTKLRRAILDRIILGA